MTVSPPQRSQHSQRMEPGRTVLVATWIVIAVALALLWTQYLDVKRSYYDDTFIYLHLAQNAIESGTWQYFPIVDRPALVASSPLRAIVVTVATALAWPITGGERSLQSAAIILPLSGIVTALLFLPFWWHDRRRYAVLLAPYALLAATLDAVVEFEAGLIYWWVATIIRDYAEQRESRATAVAAALGPFVRPDIAIIGLLSLLLAHRSRNDRMRPLLRGWFVATVALTAMWAAIALLFGVWPIPTTYWTKGALPNLFENAFMVSFFIERIGSVALNVAPWGDRSLSNALGLLWLMLVVMIAAQSRAFTSWRLIALLGAATFLISRTPSNYWWYYQNALVAFVAVAVAALVIRQTATRAASIALALSVLLVIVPSRALREPDNAWHFDKPSRAQGYQAMARTFASDGSIELPGLGRGYLNNPEIGITSYFGGHNAWIWDAGGLAQAHPDASRSALRHAYPKRLRELPQADLARLTQGRAELPLFTAWATESRDPGYDSKGNCKHMVFDRAVCVSDVRGWR
jgi:hypothetical protein